MFAEPFFCMLKLVFELLLGLLKNFNYYTFQLPNFYLVLLYNFYHFIDTLYLVRNNSHLHFNFFRHDFL